MKTRFGRKLLSVSATSALALGLIAGVTPPASASGACVASGFFDGGAGTAGDPIRIATPGQLQWLTVQMNGDPFLTDGKHYLVTADLDFGGCTFSPSFGGRPFKGVFDGGNFVISNYSIVDKPLFSAIFGEARGAEFKNVIIDGADVSGGLYVGALLGSADQNTANQPTTMHNITVKNSVIQGALSVGGIAGAGLNGDGDSLNLLRVEATEVKGSTFVGGLFGALDGYPSLKQAGVFDGKIMSAGGGFGVGFGGLVGKTGNDFSLEQGAFHGEFDLTAVPITDGNGDPNSTHAGFLIGQLGGGTLVTDSYARGVARVASTVTVGLVGDSTGVLPTLSLGYAQISVLDDQSTQVSAHPFSVESLASVFGMFYDSETHTDWSTPTAGSSGAKTSAELRDPATYAALWSLTQDVDAVRAQSAPAEVWFMNEHVNSGYPVHVWAYRAGVHPVDCPAGSASADGFAPCVRAVSQEYRGPLVSGVSAGLDAGSNGASAESAGFSVGDQVVLSGSRLGQVSSVLVSGVTALASCSEASCEFVVPAGVVPGLQDLVLLGSHGVLTIQDGIRINPAPAALPDGLRVWTRDQGDGTVKVYARDVVGVGKVQFFLNGREVAWVRAADASDPKLNLRRPVGPGDAPSTEAHGLVRTVPLVAGRNVFEIYVSGERVLRRVASGR